MDLRGQVWKTMWNRNDPFWSEKASWRHIPDKNPKSTPLDYMYFRANADHHWKVFTSYYAYLPTDIPVTADCGFIHVRRVYHG